MRITKQKAELVAERLTRKHEDVINEKKLQLTEYVAQIAESKIPEAVKQMFKEFPEWVGKDSHVTLRHTSLNNYYYRYHYIGREIPFKSGVDVSGKEAKKVKDMLDEIESLENKRSELREQIEITVYNLRTYKRCETDFPEAFKWLPMEKPTAEISIKIDDIRKQLL